MILLQSKIKYEIVNFQHRNNNSIPLDVSIESESSDDQNENGTTVPKEKTKRKHFFYTKTATFDTYAEAHESLIAEGFKRHDPKKTKAGRKTFYRCGNVKQLSKKQCEAKRMLFDDNTKTDFEVYQRKENFTYDLLYLNSKL